LFLCNEIQAVHINQSKLENRSNFIHLRLRSLRFTRLVTMLLLHAPPSSFLRTLLRYNNHNHHSSRAFFFSLSHFTKSSSIATRLFSHSRLTSLLPMNGQGLAAGGSSPEHFTGDWYSVPELRLRDHRFTVPLDHSRGPHSSPKITVFAREVVAGNASQSELRYSMIFSGFYWLHSLFRRCPWFVHEQKFSDTMKFSFFSFLICGKKKWNFYGG